jgi:DHA1 family multidrug resistance protein-like MFS transporter
MRKLVLRLPQEQWRRNRLAIHVAVALFYGGFTAVIPFLPYYLKQLGVTGEARIASWSGILITIGPLLAALLGPAWGRLGDRYGMKLMFERCTLAQGIHWLLFAFALSPYHLLGLRVLIGLLGGLTTFSVPLLVSTTPKEHMSRSIGALQTVQMLSSALGPLFGGLLADAIGIRNTCLVSAALCFAATVMMRFLFRESQISGLRHSSPSQPAHMSFRSAVALPSFGAMAAVMFFANFVERSFSPVVALYVLQLGTNPKDAAKIAGLIISLGLLSEAISASIMGNRLRKTSAKKLLLWRLAGGVVACLPMGLVWRTSQFLGLRLVLGFLAGGCMVIVYTLAGLTVPRETRGTSFSILASAAMLGGAAGPVVAGELAYVSLRAIFFFNAFVFLLLLAYCWKNVRQVPKGTMGVTWRSPEKPA